MNEFIIRLQNLEFVWSILLIFVTYISLTILVKILLFSFSKFLILKKHSRSKTLMSITSDIAKYIKFIILIMIILIIIGIDWKIIITSVSAILIGFGFIAQEIFVDIINGFFVVFEEYYEIGDYIRVGEHEGTVVSFGIKSTIIESMYQETVIVRNSRATEIINYSRKNFIMKILIPLSYNMKEKDVKKLMESKIIPEVKEINGIYNLNYEGLSSFDDSSISYQISLEVAAKDRFQSKRNINSIIKRILDEENVEIPFPQLVIHDKK